jgi:hypothetical protein
MPLMKAVKIAGISQINKAAALVSIALVVYLVIEIYKNVKETKVLAQQKEINDYILKDYVAKSKS